MTQAERLSKLQGLYPDCRFRIEDNPQSCNHGKIIGCKTVQSAHVLMGEHESINYWLVDTGETTNDGEAVFESNGPDSPWGRQQYMDFQL